MSQPLIPWPGGKRRLAKYLLSDSPVHTCYVEPFAGAAGLLFSKPPSKSEVLNDINGDLVNLYRCVQHHLDEFVRQFRWALTSRQMFKWTAMAVPDTLTDVQRAARFFYLQKLCFGGKVEGRTFGVSATGPARLNLTRLEEDLSAAHLRLSSVQVEHLPWRDCIERYDRDGTWFFIDPPYWRTTGYGVPFGMDEYETLADVLRVLKGRFTLTINDHPDMRRVFSGFRHRSVPITYTLGGGSAAKSTRELVYTDPLTPVRTSTVRNVQT